MAQGHKARLNLTIDQDIYRQSKRVFAVLGMNMSGFVEQNLATFLQVMEPLTPLLDGVESGELDPVALKTAMRAFSSSGSMLIGEGLSTFGEAQSGIAEMLEKLETLEGVDTDKK